MEESSNCSAKPIIRYTAAPTNLDYHPYGTLCLVIKNDECTEREYFVQTSKEENDPHWMSAEELLIRVHQDLLYDPCFIDKLLEQL